MHGYKDSLRSGGIWLLFNGRDDMGVCIEMTGQGCRTFETHGHGNYVAIFDVLLANEKSMNLTRLDVAFDDQDGILDLSQLIRDSLEEDSDFSSSCMVSKFRVRSAEISRPSNTEGSTLYWGSKHSDFFIRSYDKAKERGFTDRHWIRMEMQMRRSYATNFIKAAFGKGKEKLKDTFLGVLREYVRFVDDPGTDSNKRRWPTKSYWQSFLDGAGAVTLWDKPGVEYNFFNLYNYVVRQAGNAIDAYVKICGVDALRDALRERETCPNKKYEDLIAQCRREYDQAVFDFEIVTQN